MTKDDIRLGAIYSNIIVLSWFKVIYTSEVDGGNPGLVGAISILDRNISWRGTTEEFITNFTGPISVVGSTNEK